MTPGELTARVTLDTCAASAVLAALGGLVVGASVAGGVLAGGALAVLSFRWLVARAALVMTAGGAPVSAWVIGVGPRRSLSVEAIEHPPIFRLPGIPDHVTYTWVVMVILAGVAFAASRNVQ